MERLGTAAAMVFLTVVSQGCSTTWETESPPTPTSYIPPVDQLERSAGTLRRLLILPASVTKSDCPEQPTARKIEDILFKGAQQYLVDWKGYEVLTLPLPPTRAIRRTAECLGDWQETSKRDGEMASNKCLSAVLREAHGLDADGFVVLHGNLRCLNATDIILYFMIVGMPNWASKLMGENLSAGIYDAQDGRLVWKRRVNVIHPGLGGGTDPDQWVELLLGSLENALPAVLLE